jgi:hypothetical protein
MVGIVPGFSVDTPSSGSGPIDPTAFRNAALMKGRVGEAAGSDVANLFQQVADQVQDARNAKMVFDADLALNKTKDQFLTDIQKDPALASDPGKWVPEYKQRIEQTTQAIMGQENLGPAVKRHLSMMTQNFAQHSTTDVTMNALHREAEDTKESGIASATFDLQTGTEDGLAKAGVKYKSMLEAGVIGPKVYDVLMKQAPVEFAKFQASNLIQTSPGEVIDRMKAGDWAAIKDTKQREAIVREAKNAQGTNFNDLIAKNYDEKTGEVPDKVIRNAMASGDIDYKTGLNKIEAQKRESGQIDMGTKQYVGSLAHDPAMWLDQNADDVKARLYQEAAAIKNDKIMREAITDIDKEYAAVKKTGLTSDAAVHRNELGVMREMQKQWLDVIPSGNKDQRAAPYVKGGVERIETMSQSDFNEAFGRKVTRKQVLDRVGSYVDKVRDFYGNAEKTYMDWMKTKEGQNATPDQAKAERVRLGFGEYDTPRAVRADLDAGKIDADTGKKILAIRFGIQ